MLNGDPILSCKNNLRVKSFRNEKNHMYHECGVQSHFLKVCHNVFFYKFTPSLVRFECMWQYHSHLRMEYRFIDSHMIGAIPTGEPLNPIKLNPLPSGWIWSALNYICTHSALLKQKQQKKKNQKKYINIYILNCWVSMKLRESILSHFTTLASQSTTHSNWAPVTLVIHIYCSPDSSLSLQSSSIFRLARFSYDMKHMISTRCLLGYSIFHITFGAHVNTFLNSSAH